jgi:hemerythrin-like domain-containing protein
LCLDQLLVASNDKKKNHIEENKEVEIPLTEDLMREHGILNRVLLIYEEIIQRINTNSAFKVISLRDAVDIIQSFIENYHEKLEENYLFPLFEKHKMEIHLIRTLRNQHIKGRKITSKLKEIVATDKALDKKDKNRIKNLLHKFIIMYRPHEAREDTVLFPKVRSLLSKKEFDELGEKFEDLEHRLFGENGFNSYVERVSTIEKELGIYQLENFTP